MGKTSLKAREVEALTYMFTTEAPSASDAATGAGSGSRRRSWFRARPITVGLTAALVVIAALAWVMFSGR